MAERRDLQTIVSKLTRLFVTIALSIACAAPLASAGEARPWLCRDKPVFSYNSGMRYTLTSSRGRAWKVFFMAFDPAGGHDGFEIVRSAALAGGSSASGFLEGGRYFAVAMYHQGSNWICPGYAQDQEHPPAGQLNNICYGEDGPPCLVSLAVLAAH
ncbi:MAG TPA: hypothetical protein VMA09_21315 [Candidatus Binataceae bacterium]|nr:hypothetical protein [Candidatus Binataceae bacterium]